ncbi:unnamed protein product [Brachionus calyciflorus]|uniref:RNA helicase n=1 Tax=Brachionus calyciflorus TaxID=104777 RepID=A0A813QKG7_9BILA|nr:unnamed protein product [Brachionus calyciflorus]
MKEINILHIVSPSKFWIAEKDQKKFIKLISDSLENETNSNGYRESNLDEKDIRGDRLVCFYDLKNEIKSHQGTFYRARILGMREGFKSSSFFKLFLIDVGTTCSAPVNFVKPISNEHIQKLPPLAKCCCLFGIQPNGENKEWMPSSSRFINILKNNSTQILMKVIRTEAQSDSTASKVLNYVKIYLKLNPNEDLNCENNLFNLNNLLVENELANSSDPLLKQPRSSSNIFYAGIPNFRFKNSIKKSNQDLNALNAEFHDLERLVNYLKFSFKSTNNLAKSRTPSPLNDSIDSNLTVQSHLSKSNLFINDDRLEQKFSDIIELDKYVKNPVALKKVKDEFIETSNRYMLIHNAPITPITSYKDSRIHQSVRDYMNLNGVNNISSIDSYFWASIIQGLHTVYIPEDPDPTKNDPSSFVNPLLSTLLEKISHEKKLNRKQTGYVTTSIAQSQCENGPILLIVCGSSENAQRIYELVNNIIETDTTTCHKERIKRLLIQGGGHDEQYDVPLANGVDILIAATPFCLLRAIGSAKTNLERLKYLVFDEGYLLLEKFPYQIKTLMEVYANLVKISNTRIIAQLILVSSFWSTKLEKFINSFMVKPAFIIGNKLEASFFGKAHHILKDFSQDGSIKTSSYLEEIIQNNRHKNILICANKFEKCLKLFEFVKKLKIENVECITTQTKVHRIDRIEKKFSQEEGHILIIEQNMLENVNLDTIKCVINYEFPETKTAYAQRLWTMRKYFTYKKEITVRNEPTINSGSLNDLNRDELELKITNDCQLVDKESESLCSFLFLTKTVGTYADGLCNFLTRIGYKTNDFPPSFMTIVENSRAKKELSKFDLPLCPFIKSFGACLHINPNSCKYRHKPHPKVDKINDLDKGLSLPNEGYVRFKISFVRDTNNFFVNILSHQGLNRENEVVYDRFKNLDLDLQLYFSNANNVKYPTKFRESEMYAFKDTTTSIFKRIKIEEVIKRDGQIAHDLIVKCIDYGSKFKIYSHDLIILPEHFKELPPQGVEVYLCDIRPIEKDLTWSVPSRVFLSEKLLRHKEFIGKIQLAVGSTLWLHPITSYKYLKTLDLIIREDSIQSELIQNNYGVHYPLHLTKLRKLFEENGLFIPKLEDELLKTKREANEFFENFYNLIEYKEDEFTPNYSFLNKSSISENKVYLSSIESFDKLYLQLTKFQKQLENLNEDICDFIKRILDNKEKYKIKNGQRLDDSFDEQGTKLDEQTIKDLKYWERTLLMREKMSKNILDYLATICKKFFCLVNTGSEYNRAQILEFESKEKIKVFCVDFGDCKYVSVDALFPIMPKFIGLLPFQAIECSLDSIIPVPKNERKENLIEPIDFFISLTRDEDRYYFDLFVEVLETFDSNNYSIRLFKQNYPENIDLSHELVVFKYAKLKPDEEIRIFPFLEEKSLDSEVECCPLYGLTKQFVNLFIRGSDETKQSPFLQALEHKTGILQMKTQDELITIGLLQCLSKGISFIENTQKSIQILKFIRKNFFLRKNDCEGFSKLFAENYGLANVLNLIKKSIGKDQEFVNFGLNFLKEIITFSNELKYFIAYNTPYLKAFWYFLDLFKDDQVNIEKCLGLIEQIVKSFDSELVFDDETTNFILNLRNKIKLWLTLEQLDRLNNLCDEFELRELKIEEKEDEEPEEIIELEKIEKEEMRDMNNNYELPDDLDSDLENQFFVDFMNMLAAGSNLNTKSNISEQPGPNIWAPRTDYKYPKCSWNQNNEFVFLKIFLKIKECDLKFKDTWVSFRCQYNGETFGIDLDLFAQIEIPVESGPDNDYFKITMKKKIQAIWIRLLSSVIKPSFIKCEFDNIQEDSEDDEERKKKEYNEFLENMRDKKTSIERPNFRQESPENSDTESESDFEDNYTDMKESKDYRWD